MESYYMVHYFAYGSNLHPKRLMERAPSANLVGIAKHPYHRLAFHKKGKDGSSKCNLFSTDFESDLVYGAIYTLEPEHKNALDYYEGKGYGYVDTQIKLESEGKEYTCYTYLAQQSHIADNLKPYHWYKHLVILGARYLRFPDWYISLIESVESIEDLNGKRRMEKEALIDQIFNFRQ